MSEKERREERERRLKKMRRVLRDAVDAALDNRDRLVRLRAITDEEWDAAVEADETEAESAAGLAGAG